jgi:putative endonuclease
MWYVYILKCSDGSYYVGHTDNLPERVLMHNSQRGAKWTACRVPVTLVYSERYETEKLSMNRESQIKRWSHTKKEALIAGDIATLHKLAKRKKERLKTDTGTSRNSQTFRAEASRNTIYAKNEKDLPFGN